MLSYMTVAPIFVEHGVCHTQGAAGLAFNRDMAKDPESKAEYTKLTGHAEKADFRAKWAKLKLVEAEEKLEAMQMDKCESHTQETVAVGTYLPFKKIWDQEGADHDGYVAFRGTQMVCISKLLHPVTWQMYVPDNHTNLAAKAVT